MWRGKVKAIYSTTYTIISFYIPKIHPMKLTMESPKKLLKKDLQGIVSVLNRKNRRITI